MHPHATIALHAARHCRQWGRVAALRYVQSRGVSLRLYYLARTLHAASNLGD